MLLLCLPSTQQIKWFRGTRIVEDSYSVNESGVMSMELTGIKRQGRPSPLRSRCISPCFRFPLFSKKFQTVENVKNFTSSWKISRFSSAKISDDLFIFSHRPQISNFPLFSLFQYISSLFRENYYFPPTFKNFLPVLEKFTCFLHTLCVHPMHVLDAPGKRKRWNA